MVIRNVSREADIWSIFIYVRIEQLAFSVSTPRIVLLVNKYTIFSPFADELDKLIVNSKH